MQTISQFVALTPRMPFAGFVVAAVALDFGGQTDMLTLSQATKIGLADLNRALEYARSQDLCTWYGNAIAVHPRFMVVQTEAPEKKKRSAP